MTSDHAILWILEESDKAFDVSLPFEHFPHKAPPQCKLRARALLVCFPVAIQLMCLNSLVQSLMNKEGVMDVPPTQRMQRQDSLAKHMEEYRAAIERAVALDIPHAYSPSYGTFQESDKGQNSNDARNYFSG